jgi:hypothetical protein
MEAEVTLTIPMRLYARAERLAAARQQPVAEVLDEAIALVEAYFSLDKPEEACMAQEERAYRAMHAELLTKFLGCYVAIHKGQLIDHDPSEMALLQRLNQTHPNDVVLMRLVQPGPEPPLVFRSPRFL